MLFFKRPIFFSISENGLYFIFIYFLAAYWMCHITFKGFSVYS